MENDNILMFDGISFLKLFVYKALNHTCNVKNKKHELFRRVARQNAVRIWVPGLDDAEKYGSKIFL